MSLDLEIVTPEGEAFSGPVDWVVLPGSQGDFGVLVGHERFLAPLRLGAVELSEAGRRQWAALSGGFADVGAAGVVVLADACQRAESIDAAAAERDRQRADEALAALGDSDDDRAKRPGLETARARAELWLEVSGRG